MKSTITEALEVPEGLTVSYDKGTLRVEGGKGSVERKLYQPRITVRVEDGTVVLEAKDATQREKRHLYTLRAHAKNMLKGASEGHTYKLKICSGHFPMNVAIANNVLTVKNFLGEAVPRTLKLKAGCDVKIDGDTVVVTSSDIETAGAQASDIEQLTRITNRDRRIFQDGLYIIEKDGEAIQ